MDDDVAVLSALRRLFRGDPCEVVATPEPWEALKIARARRVRLLIADERMPRMSGSDLCREVWRRSPDTACVLLTAYPEAVPATPAARLAIRRLIAKPWDDRTLRHAARSLLERRGPPPSPDSAAAAEFTLIVECRGETSEDVLGQVRAFALGIRARPASLTIRFRRLEEMHDATDPFLEDLGRELRSWNLTAFLIDASGTVAAFLDTRDRSAALQSCDPEELPAAL